MRNTVITRLHANDANDISRGGVFETIEDCAPLLAEAHAARDALEHFGKPKSDEFMPVCKVPVHVVEQSMREGWFNDKARWRQWMNDPDNKLFRIYGGRV